MLRPLRPLYSRFVLVLVDAGSMAYSAVTQPLRLARRHAGSCSSMVAVHMTRVSPNSARHEPWAFFMTLRVRVTGRILLAARPSGRRSGVMLSDMGLLTLRRGLPRGESLGWSASSRGTGSPSHASRRDLPGRRSDRQTHREQPARSHAHDPAPKEPRLLHRVVRKGAEGVEIDVLHGVDGMPKNELPCHGKRRDVVRGGGEAVLGLPARAEVGCGRRG